MIFDGLRDHDDPGLDIRRLALTGAVTETRRRPGFWSMFGPALPLAFAAGMLAGVTLRVMGL